MKKATHPSAETAIKESLPRTEKFLPRPLNRGSLEPALSREKEVSMDFTFSNQLHYLIHHSDGEYVAHCLDMDLVGSGPRIEDAIAELNTAVRALVFFALKNETVELLGNCKAAPDRYWEMFDEARRTGTTEIRTLEINPAMAPVTVNHCHFTYCLAMAA